MDASHMPLRPSLSLKIIVVLVITLTVVLSGTTYFSIQSQRAHLEQVVQLSAERSSNFAKKALRQGMEVNHQEDIWRTITDLGSEPGIERIRIYDKRGVIRYSTSHNEVWTTVDVNADACTMCHGNASDFERTASEQFVRIYEAPDGHRVLGFINPIANERSCWDADCHAHTKDQTYLGVLDVQMSLAKIDTHIGSGVNLLLLASLVTLLAVALVSGVFVYVVVHKPVKQVIEGTKALARGELRHKITVPSTDEIGELAHSFNDMGEELHSAEQKLVEWSNTLEQKVEEKTHELQQAQAQVLHMEKMASLGKLSSMIAHELNNPLSGILTYAKLIRKRLGRPDLTAEQLAAIDRDLTLISDESKRCGDIVRNLLFFARGQSGSFAPCYVREVAEKALRLIQHQIDMQRIEVTQVFPESPIEVICDQNQIQQVLLALMMNAVEAMPDGGDLRLTLTDIGEDVRIEVRDTGVGIPVEDLPRIFEPFYTTKESGFGTGLGLSIVYGILRSHGGDIAVESTLGIGSTFTIILPKHAHPPHATTGGTEHDTDAGPLSHSYSHR